MSAERFGFGVTKVDDQAIVHMDCGQGVVRARNMPAEFLETLMTVCVQVRDSIIAVVKEDAERMDTIPSLPECACVGGGNVGPCDVRVVVSKNEAGEPEFCTAFYDEGDETAPVLVLVDEQLQEFIDRAQMVLAPN